MSNKKKNNNVVPKFRFPEFQKEKEWDKKKLGELLEFKNGINASKEQYGKGIKFINVLDIIQNTFITYDKIIGSVEISEKEISKNEVCYGDIVFQRSSETREDAGQANVYLDKEKTAVFGGFVIRGKMKSEYEPMFMNYLLKTSFVRKEITSRSAGSTRYNIGQDALNEVEILFPSFPEQQKIAACLTSLDDLIQTQNEKLDFLKVHKKGLLQQLFPAEGERVPRLRFSEFVGKWNEIELSNCLDYLQPTKYLVESAKYNNSYPTPVLTAGKTFILGYTNEKDGVFNKGLPVIIFDDFTTASKFVDFPFKAKSSAMKILLEKKGYNIRFIYESMQIMKFEKGVHKRHWISIFSKLKIAIPTLKEQQKIAECFYSLDKLIKEQTERITSLKAHKKGLMQQLFPNFK